MSACRTGSVGRFLIIMALVVLAGTPAVAQTFNSGSTGADGAFNPPTSTTLTLPPNGVFNFTTITIPAGVTVTFARNAANTPAILLAQGAVTINGTLDVSGASAGPLNRPGAGGPGGFDGGAGADGITSGLGGAGLGPGGGGGAGAGQNSGGGGGHVAAGTPGYGGIPGAGGAAYGNPALRPILGGSGGGGGGGSVGSFLGGGGGGGGGAILIASSTSIALSTSSSSVVVRANGGSGGSGSVAFVVGGAGSGGAIRLIAPTIMGSGQLVATGGANGTASSAGRIRLEASTLTYTGTTSPLASTVFPQPVFPPAGQPSLAIASIGGLAVPATPAGSVLAAPDVLLPAGTTNPVEVLLTASNIPLGTVIQVTATPQSGAKTTAISTGLAGTLASSTATASLSLSLSQTSVITATATFPLVARAAEGPLYAGGPVLSLVEGPVLSTVEGPVLSTVEGPVLSTVEGEEVAHIKVAAVLGGGSTLTYVTRSGREFVLP